MPEFTSVSASSYDPASLAAKLTEKSAEGWVVVAIVPTGGDITAFLSRGAAISVQVINGSAATATGPVAVTEPTGWASAPSTQTAPVGGSYGTGAAMNPQPASQPTPAQPAQATNQHSAVTAAATSGTSSSTTPAGWYHDPSGRFELRYWDGAQWTEHVARGGNQFTDPPVA